MPSTPDTIEVVEPAFRRLVLANAPLLTLGEGFGYLEGPVWWADAHQLLVSDIPRDRILRWTEDGGVSVFRQPSGFANGQTRDRQGRLVGCSHQHRCVVRTELDGSLTMLADRYQGRRLNSPNDVVVHGDGAVWFSDPIYGISTDYEGGKAEPELKPALYRLDPATGTLRIAADDIVGPNGLCFSPDERTLYVADTGEQFDPGSPRHIRAYDVGEDGFLSNSRVFARISPGSADGLRCDEDGRVWSSAGDGVHCLDAAGTLLGRIRTGGPIANLAFGGRHRSRLFLCAGQSLLAIYTNVRGAQRP